MWRLIIGLGCLPGVVALYFRLTISETPRFTIDIQRNIEQARYDIRTTLHTGDAPDQLDLASARVQAPSFGLKDFISYFSQREHMKVLIGTAYSWFALDVGPSTICLCHN